MAAYISIGTRAIINVEALNMVESVGGVTRHRTVPVIVQTAPGKYLVRWAPAISGEALAHRYQLAVVDLTKGKCPDRLDYWSEQGEFLKHFDLEFYKILVDELNVLKEWEKELIKDLEKKNLIQDPRRKEEKRREEKRFKREDIEDVERRIVTNSVVEDIAGFLATQGPVKRTSRASFSYVIPTSEAVELGAAQIDTQFQVRHAPKASGAVPDLPEGRNPQMPYYVQVTSAVYSFTVNLDLQNIGVLSTTGEVISDKQCPPETRREIAIRALEPILDLDFGAKKSRFQPHGYVELAMAIVSQNRITVAPPSLRFREFVEKTIERARKLGGTIIAWTPKEDVAEELKKVMEQVEKGKEQRAEQQAERQSVGQAMKSARETGSHEFHVIKSATPREFIERLVEISVKKAGRL